MRPRNPESQQPKDLFARAAERQHRVATELYDELHVSDAEAAGAAPPEQ